MGRPALQFVHLRTRSPYSLLEGATRIEQLIEWAVKHEMPALALTDTNNMCGALEFSEKLHKAGLQPIIGCTLSIDLELPMQPGEIRRDPNGTLVLLAQTERGYENLMVLSSSGFLDIEPTDMPHIKASLLAKHSEGLIALTGGHDSVLNQLIVAGRDGEAQNWLDLLSGHFKDRLYVELQRHGAPDEAITEPKLLDMAYAMELPLVASNEPFFYDKHVHTAHDALLAIADSSYILEKDRRHVTREHYLKTGAQMAELFFDLPEALDNSVDIARRCSYRTLTRDPILPNFGDGSSSEADILAEQAREGLEARIQHMEKWDQMAQTREVYFKRLEFELGVIAQMGFPGYFLIVSDFMKWAIAQGIPVGPGRGSGAGSVVAWSLMITDLDPLRYGLLFERFLNPERVSMPDFDIDFCQERRHEVIKYVQDKYGKDQVAQIIAFGTLQARAVVRDVGRVMQMPLGQVDRLSKMIPSNPANPVSLSEAVKIEPRLQSERDSDPAVAELLTVALELEGLYRNASTHAAGVVIGDRPLTQLVPLYIDPRSEIPCTQFDMKWVEKAGLVKFDFLGLKTLTVIDRTLKYLAERGIDLDMHSLSVEDKKAYEPLAEGATDGVFQLESSGMRDVLRKMQPSTIEELTALISLYRPGPMKNIDTYIDRKFGRVPIKYPHPSLKDILEETYGVIIYQEQVMKIAQVLSGYSLGDADLLRRAMGKKDQAEMDRQRSRFIEGAAKNDVNGQLANEIFDLVNEFAGYGFNKSHAAAYAVVAFNTAYLKAHHPVEFMAAIMSLDISNTEKLAQFHAEVKRLKLPLVAPDVNHTQADFAVKDGKILYALGALKNVGVSAMQHVVDVREQGGPFKDLHDFARRIDTRIVNKRALENLARSGAFDSLEPNRARAFAAAPDLQSIGSRAADERNSNQGGLFGDAPDAMEEKALPDAAPWPKMTGLEQELSAIGFYLSGHPLDEHMHMLSRHTMAANLERAYGSKRGPMVLKFAGVVIKRQERMSKRGKRFCYLELSDPTGGFEIFVGEDILMASREIMKVGKLVEVSAKVEGRDGEIKIYANKVAPLDMVINGVTTAFKIHLRSADVAALVQSRLESFANAPSKSRGKITAILPIDGGREAEFELAGRYCMDEAIYNALRSVSGVEKIDRI